MPVYDYECSSCEQHFEKALKIAEVDQPTSEPCPNCQTESAVQQVMGASPFIDSVRLGIKKPDRTFQREVVGRIKNNVAHNKIGIRNKFDIPGRI